jgi:HAD superfamily hydrolase (TIGR01509 family)
MMIREGLMPIRTRPVFDALLLDFDGVVIDSETTWWNVIDEVARDRGLVPANGHVERRSGIRVQDTIARMVPDDEELAESMTKEVLRIGESRLAGMSLADGAVEAIRKISATRIILGLVSSSNSVFLDHVLRVNRIRDYFSVLVGGDRVERGKPAPDGYLLASREANVLPERCCAVEDSSSGILAAANAGMYVVHFGGRSVADPIAMRHVSANAATFAVLADIMLGGL